ncbi:hypothetical protein HanRHA438_Chr15g0732421 [Helianthus annuus]|nr:hypothetical protein HanRHA438_Chr15g0732421 [Helianthus annuus]
MKMLLFYALSMILIVYSSFALAKLDRQEGLSKSLLRLSSIQLVPTGK